MECVEVVGNEERGMAMEGASEDRGVAVTLEVITMEETARGVADVPGRGVAVVEDLGRD